MRSLLFIVLNCLILEYLVICYFWNICLFVKLQGYSCLISMTVRDICCLKTLRIGKINHCSSHVQVSLRWLLLLCPATIKFTCLPFSDGPQLGIRFIDNVSGHIEQDLLRETHNKEEECERLKEKGNCSWYVARQIT